MAYLLLLVLPSVAVLYYYYNRDRHREPWRQVALVYFAGALSIFIALPLEQFAHRWFPREHGDLAGLLLLGECLVIPGLIEESVKLLVVLAVIFWRRDFNEPIDGLVYGTAAALGFAFAEDWRLYVLQGPDWRRVLSAITHPWFSCMWASALGWLKFRSKTHGIILLLTGLLASAIVHGVYDFLVLVSEIDETRAWVRHLLTPVLLMLYLIMERRLEADRRGANEAKPEIHTSGEPVASEGSLRN